MNKLENFNKRAELFSEAEALAAIKQKTIEMMEGVLEYHGLEHTYAVVDYAKAIAAGEGQDLFTAEAAALTHDWGRVNEKTDSKHRSHAQLSREASRDFYKELWKKGNLTTEQYGEIQRAIGRHSKIGESSRETLKIVRDADKLSRYGSLGIFHIVSGLVGKIPFYTEGRPLLREEGAPIIKLKEIECIVDHLNICLDWENMVETGSGKAIMERQKSINKAFLALIASHKDLNDANLWQAFLQGPAFEFKDKKNQFSQDFVWTGEREDFERWLSFYAGAESPDIFSEENFQKFLTQYKKDHEYTI